VHYVFAAHVDHLYAHFPIEASIFQRVKQAVAGVKDISWLGSGGPFHLVISMKKRTEGEPMRAAMAALSASNLIKHVIVVDEEVDPENAREVMWAIATCSQADSSITILKNMQGHVLDPSLRQDIKGAGLVIDATRPMDRPYPPRAGLPPEILKRFNLNDYLDTSS
jgi:2,5-furandicarboxylate decarboxylase 1